MYDDQYDIWNLDQYLPPQQEPAPPASPPEQLGSFGAPINSSNPAGYMDLSYWQSRHDQGLPGSPSLNDIFDLKTGQMRPGWSRTERGYEMTPMNAPAPTPTGAPPPPYGGGGGGDQWGYLTQPFGRTPPQWQSGPSFNAPTFAPPPPFSYKAFAAPDQNSIYSDPSYQFRKGEGEQALAQRAASMGKYRTGGTMKDFINYNQNAASQEYANIFGRAVDAHNLGLQQELGTYATNYGVTRDAYDRLFNESKAEFEPLQRENEMMNQREFDKFLAEYDIFDRDRRRAGDYLYRNAALGAG